MADIVYPGQTTGGTLGADFLPSNFDLTLWKGDFFPLKVTLRSSDGTPLNLTGYTAQAQVRTGFDDPIAYPFEVTITPATGEINLLLSSDTTSDMIAGSYVWDFQVTQPDGNVRTYIAGDVKIHDEVTR